MCIRDSPSPHSKDQLRSHIITIMEPAGKEKTPGGLVYAARSMEGLQIKELLPNCTVGLLRSFPEVQSLALAKDCAALAFSTKAGITLLETKKFTALKEIACEYVVELMFSSTGKFVIAYKRSSPNKISQMVIYETTSGTKVNEVQWRRSCTIAEFARFSANDEYMLISPFKTEVILYSCSESFKPLVNYKCALVLSIEMVPSEYVHPETPGPYFSVVEPIPKTEDVCAKFVPIKSPADSKAVMKKFDIQKVDTATTLMSPSGSAVLFWLESQEDPTGKCYYGVHCMHYMQLVGGKKRCKVFMEGSTIHDARWSPDGKSFVMLSGSQPAKIVVFNHECNPMYELSANYKNYARFSDGGRFLMLGGFGNLAGDIEFWDFKRKAVMGNCKAFCTVTSEWASSSKLIMTAILNPRMRVDNSITFFDFAGKKLVMDPYTSTELYEVKWIKGDSPEMEGDITVPIDHTCLLYTSDAADE
eukprot:TRINITY_DN3402_c0_g5_i5.p1 TRINITY_DN3402_c0_g5~~TRINITY_DN3402_c0_g5_i5.p1  ORF type:complete len:489 (-),score=129.27 TRINITY_DN3402_c0_g5_i5:49-1470(-)